MSQTPADEKGIRPSAKRKRANQPVQTALTLRQKIALRFTTAIMAPLAEKILNEEDNQAVDDAYKLIAKEGFAMAEAFFEVADEVEARSAASRKSNVRT